MQDVIAGEPVERAAVPVLPQRFRLLRRGEAVAETGVPETGVVAAVTAEAQGGTDD